MAEHASRAKARGSSKPVAVPAAIVWRIWATPPFDPAHFYQQRITDTPCADSYVATGGNVKRLGIVRQLFGGSWLHANAFGETTLITDSDATNGLLVGKAILFAERAIAIDRGLGIQFPISEGGSSWLA